MYSLVVEEDGMREPHCEFCNSLLDDLC
jgi:hypothetical protein